MATREITQKDLTRSGNGNGHDPDAKAQPKPMPGIKRLTKRGTSSSAAAKNAVLPGRQVKAEAESFWGAFPTSDETRRAMSQSEDTIAAIKAVRDFDAQASYAVSNFLRLINPGHDFKAYAFGPDGSEDPEEGEAQLACDDWAKRVGAEYGGGLDQLHNVLALMLLTNGAVALEVELNSTLDDIVDWHPIDPLLLSFQRVTDEDGVERLHIGQTVNNQWVQVNEATVFYQPLDPDVGDPYGRPPLLAAVQNILYLTQLTGDIRAMAHNQGFPRLDVAVVWDAIQAAAPQPIRDDPQAFQEWATAQLNAIVNDYEELSVDDTFVHYDFVSVGTSGGGAGAFDFVGLDRILTRRVTMALKALPITIGINESTSETHGSIQWQIQVASIENFQRQIKRVLEKAGNVSLRVKGLQAHSKVEYEEIRTVDRLYESQSDYFDRRNAQFDVQMNWITNDEAAERIVGHASLGPPLGLEGNVQPTDEFGNPIEGNEPPAQGGPSSQIPEQPGRPPGDEDPWWAGLFGVGEGATDGGTGQGKQVEKPPAGLPGSTADPTVAWKLLLAQPEVSGYGHRRFRRDPSIPAEAAVDVPIDHGAPYAEAGHAAFELVAADVLAELIAEGLIDTEDRDVASDIGDTFRRSLVRQMKPILRKAIEAGIAEAGESYKAPTVLVDEIWARNAVFINKITGDFVAFLRTSVSSIGNAAEWFAANQYRIALMGRHLGKQGITAGFAYATDRQGKNVKWTRTIQESCESCVTRGGVVFSYATLRVVGFPGGDELDCMANCQCILVPTKRKENSAGVRAWDDREWDEAEHPRADDGKFVQKDGNPDLEAAVMTWKTVGGCKGVRDAQRGMDDPTDEQRATADVLLDQIADSVCPVELYRGVGGPRPRERGPFLPPEKMVVGAEIDMVTSSFSESRDVATTYMSTDPRKQSVLFVLQAGAHAVNIQPWTEPRPGHPAGWHEFEWIGAGRYRVTAVSSTKYFDNVIPVLSITEVGTWQARIPLDQAQLIPSLERVMDEDEAAIRLGSAGVRERDKKFEDEHPRDEHGQKFVDKPDDESVSGEEAHNLLSSTMLHWDQIPAEQWLALRGYQSVDFRGLNQRLRDGETLSGDRADQVASMEKALTGLPSDMTVFRGVGPKYAAAMTVGTRFTDLGFTSSSLNPAEAREFADDRAIGEPKGTVRTYLEVSVPKGTKAFYFGGGHEYDTSYESEVLLQRGLSFEVTGSREVDGYRVITLEVRP